MPAAGFVGWVRFALDHRAQPKLEVLAPTPAVARVLFQVNQIVSVFGSAGDVETKGFPDDIQDWRGRAMKFMRHKSIAITEKFYCRYGQDQAPIDVL